MRKPRNEHKVQFFKLKFIFFCCQGGKYFSSLQKDRKKTQTEINSGAVYYPVYFYHHCILNEPGLNFELNVLFTNFRSGSLFMLQSQWHHLPDVPVVFVVERQGPASSRAGKSKVAKSLHHHLQSSMPAFFGRSLSLDFGYFPKN